MSSSNRRGILHVFFFLPCVAGLSVETSASTRDAALPPPFLPNDPDEMIRQASAAIARAFQNNLHRQTIRLPLSESMYGQTEESFVADRVIGWQGGPQETYRYLSPMAEQLLKSAVMTKNTESDNSGLPPKLEEQVLLDFDGSSLLNAQSPLGAVHDGIAIVQPTTDQYYMDQIKQLEKTFSDTPDTKAKRLFLLINPAWKYDASSWGFFQKKFAQQQILERYPTTYAIDQFIVKGQKISLLKVWPSDWCAYVKPLPPPKSQNTENDSPPPLLLGTFTERPVYAQLEALVS